MSNTASQSPATQRQPGRRPLLTPEECKQIAADLNGTTECIDALLAKWSAVRPGVKRHNILQAAKRGGYRTQKERKDWTPEED